MNKLLVGLMALAFSLSVQAESVQLKFDGANTGLSSKINISGDKKTVAMGSYNLIEKIGDTTKSLVGFCVDPFESPNPDYKTYEKSGLDASDFDSNGATRLTNVQKLFDNAYGTLGTDATKTAGFHLALWELFNDDGNLTSGLVKIVNATWWSTGSNAGMVAAAQGFLDNIATWLVTDDYTLTFYGNEGSYNYYKQWGKWCKEWKPGYQDFLIAEKNPPSEVPVPAALPLFASAVLGMGFMRRRKFV